MAKAKNADMEIEYFPSQHIEFDDAEEVKGLSVGDKIKIVLTGTVKMIEQRQSYDDPKKIVSSVCLTKFEAEIIPQSTQFDDLLEDD